MSTIQTYLLYYFIIVFTSVIVGMSEKMRGSRYRNYGKFIFWIALSIPVIVSGFRYGIGVDYFNYERIYYRITSSNNLIDEIINTRYEPGWILLNYFVKYIFDDVKYVFIVSSLLIWLFHFKAIYHYKNSISVGIAIFILLSTLYNPSFNIIRQSLAASILLLTIKPILDKSFWKFIVITLLAACFHYTSLVFLPAYWIVNSKKENVALVKKVISIIITILLILFANQMLSFITSFEMFSAYNHYQMQYDDLGFGMVILRLPVIVIILLNLGKLRSQSNPMYLLSILYFIGIILKFFGYLADYVGRIATYYEMIQILILAAIVKVQRNKYEKLLYAFLIIIYFIGMYTLEIIIENGHKTIPYNWVN